MSLRKIILLDIDGVIAPIGPTHTDNRSIKAPYGVQWEIPAATAKTLQKWAAEKETQVVWISAWEDDSNIINQHLHLPPFPFLKITSCDGNKVPDIVHYCLTANLPTGVELFIVDDELTQHDQAQLQRSLTQYRHRIIIPDSKTGLSNEQLAAMNGR